jgi:hypothetical protein
MDFVAAARSLLLFGRDPEDTERRVITHAKANATKKGRSIAYDLGEDGVFHFGEYTDLKDTQIVGNIRQRDKGSPVLDEVVEVLKGLVGMFDRFWTDKLTINRIANRRGYSNGTLKTAREEADLTAHYRKQEPRASLWHDAAEKDAEQCLEEYDEEVRKAGSAAAFAKQNLKDFETLEGIGGSPEARTKGQIQNKEEDEEDVQIDLLS